MVEATPGTSGHTHTTPLVPFPVVTIQYGPTQIHAPASFVFKVLRDVSTWPKWNTFVPRCEILSQPSGREAWREGQPVDTALREGTLMRMHGSIGALPFRTTAVINKIYPQDGADASNSHHHSSPTFAINWCKPILRHDWIPSWVLQFERTHEIRVLGNALCEIETWDCQDGAMAHQVKLLLGKKLKGQFKNWIEGLREYCEREWKATASKM